MFLQNDKVLKLFQLLVVLVSATYRATTRFERTTKDKNLLPVTESGFFN
jgi:hypothetical protein